MFQFKQFKIEQHLTAMKVTTDACILGASVNVSKAANILDIGAGTGLLSLMMAQRTRAEITAVEIDQNAFEQALENINQSIFREQIKLFHLPIQKFSPARQYDLIVSNPPFFQNHLKSDNLSRNKALHTETLSFEELLESVGTKLKPSGSFVVLLPVYETELLCRLALAKDLFPVKQLKIRHRESSKIFRIITTFEYSEEKLVEESLIIKNPDETYTTDFQNLLKDYYLIF